MLRRSCDVSAASGGDDEEEDEEEDDDDDEDPDDRPRSRCLSDCPSIHSYTKLGRTRCCW